MLLDVPGGASLSTFASSIASGKGGVPEEEALEFLDIDSEGDEDIDTVQNAFPVAYYCSAKKSVSLENYSVLKIDASWNSTMSGLVAAGLSDNSVVVFNAEGLTTVKTLIGHSTTVTDVRFSKTNQNCVYSSSEDGTIRLWDTRLGESCVSSFKDDSEGPEQSKWKPFSTMDVNCDDTFICGGTEQIGDDSFLLFFDIRSTKILGGYWESHLEDVTKVKFHPTDKNRLASGSVDGLINVFDISQPTEDDALLYTLGCVTSPEKLTWCKRGSSEFNHLGVVGQSEEFQLWDIEESMPTLKYDRDQVAKSLMRKSPEACYLIESFQFEDSEDIFVMGGSKRKFGGCLRLLQIQKKKLKGCSSLIDSDTLKNQIVRAAAAHPKEKIFVSGGEDGIVNVWREGTEPEVNTEIKSKADSTFGKAARHKPY